MISSVYRPGFVGGSRPLSEGWRASSTGHRAELEELLEISIANRRADQVGGVFDAVDPRHTARIAEEESLLEFIQSMR